MTAYDHHPPDAASAALTRAVARLRRRRRVRRRLARALVVAAVVVVTAAALTASTWWWASSRFARIERFEDFTATSDNAAGDLTAASTPAGAHATLTSEPSDAGTAGVSAAPSAPETGPQHRTLDDLLETYLVFATGTTGLTPVEALDLGVSDPEQRGADTLTDVLMLVVVNTDTQNTTVISIPRDTWIERRGDRINATYPRFGVQELAADVTELFGVGVDHVIGVDMKAFVELTDLVGGVRLPFEVPGRDLATGVSVDGPACEFFDGRRALALVRSRTWQNRLDGRWVPEGTGDFGRIGRQQLFLSSLLDDLRHPSSLRLVPRLFDTAEGHLRIDDRLTLADVTGLARRFVHGDGDVSFVQLPGSVARKGAKSVVVVNDDADALFDHLAAGAAEPYADAVIVPPVSSPVPVSAPADDATAAPPLRLCP
jgi:LCP family protein required for cell wall assembly